MSIEYFLITDFKERKEPSLYKKFCDEVNKNKLLNSFKMKRNKIVVNYYINASSGNPVVGFYYKKARLYECAIFKNQEDYACPYFAKKKTVKNIFKFILLKVEKKFKEIK